MSRGAGRRSRRAVTLLQLDSTTRLDSLEWTKPHSWCVGCMPVCSAASVHAAPMVELLPPLFTGLEGVVRSAVRSAGRQKRGLPVCRPACKIIKHDPVFML